MRKRIAITDFLLHSPRLNAFDFFFNIHSRSQMLIGAICWCSATGKLTAWDQKWLYVEMDICIGEFILLFEFHDELEIVQLGHAISM